MDDEKRRVLEVLAALDPRHIDEEQIRSLNPSSVFSLLHETAEERARSGVQIVDIVKLSLLAFYLDCERAAAILSQKNLKNSAEKILKSAFIDAFKLYVENKASIKPSLIAAFGSVIADYDWYSYKTHYTLLSIAKRMAEKGWEFPPSFFISLSQGLIDDYVFLADAKRENDRHLNHLISILKAMSIPLKAGQCLPARDANDLSPFLEKVRLAYRFGNSIKNFEVRDLAAQIFALVGKNGQDISPYSHTVFHTAATTASAETRRYCLECAELLLSKANTVEALNDIEAKIASAREARIEMINQVVSNAAKFGLRLKAKDPVLLKFDLFLDIVKNKREFFLQRDVMLDAKIKPPQNNSGGGSAGKNQKLCAL